MGWGRMLLPGNSGQQKHIGDLDNAVGQMPGEVSRYDALGRDLEIEKN